MTYLTCCFIVSTVHVRFPKVQSVCALFPLSVFYTHTLNVLAWLPDFFILVRNMIGFRLLLRFHKIDFLRFFWELFPWWFRIISKIPKAFFLKINLILRHICWNDLWVSVYLFASWRSFMFWEIFSLCVPCFCT